MPTVNIPDHLHHRLETFLPVARALLNEDVDLDNVIEIIVEAGLRDSLNAIIRPQEEATLVQALHQLAWAAPELVYGHTADMLALGADLRAQREAQRRIGFRPLGSPIGLIRFRGQFNYVDRRMSYSSSSSTSGARRRSRRAPPT